MSVSIGNQGSQIYVELNHNGKSVQIPCKDKNEAEQVAEAAKKAEEKIAEKENAQDATASKGVTTPAGATQPQIPAPTNVNLAQGTYSADVGGKLDKVG